MEYRQRRLIAAVILALSLLIVGYLIFFTPTESEIPTPTPTSAEVTPPNATKPPSTPESDEKRTAEAGAVQLESTQAQDGEDVGDEERQMAAMPDWMGRIASNPENSTCPETAVRTVDVTDAEG